MSSGSRGSFQNSRFDKTALEPRLVQQEIDATGVKIDALVYGLYGLSEEEIAVIEETGTC